MRSEACSVLWVFRKLMIRCLVFLIMSDRRGLLLHRMYILCVSSLLDIIPIVVSLVNCMIQSEGSQLGAKLNNGLHQEKPFVLFFGILLCEKATQF